jgi:predicted GNAT superfamily acetyltransferase
MKILFLDQSSLTTPAKVTASEIVSWEDIIGSHGCNAFQLQTHDIVAVKLKKGYEIVKHRFDRQQKFPTKKAFLAHIAKYM